MAFTPMKVRKLADRSAGRVTTVDHATGAPQESWPLLGVAFEGEAPTECRVPTSWVQMGVAEGWIEREGERVAFAAGGPQADPWRVTHTFVQCDAIVLHMTDGDYRYRVTHNPGKYADDSRTEAHDTNVHGQTADAVVDWYYALALEV